jgi:hypothetical protein
MTEMAFEWHLKKDDAILQGLYVGSYSKGVTTNTLCCGCYLFILYTNLIYDNVIMALWRL